MPYKNIEDRRKNGVVRVNRYRASHPEYKKACSKRRYDRRKELLHELKDVPCQDCNVRYPPHVMQFDHVPERGEKLLNIGAAFHAYSLEKVMAEIAKCDLVCANCHAERTHQRRPSEA